jgi:hypothetical protein
MKPKLLPLLSLSLVVVSLGRGQDPARGGASGGLAAENSQRIGPRPTFADLAYANQSPAEKLDLYLPPPNAAPAPLVIWIHGGGFMVGDKRSMPRQNFGPAPKPTSLMGPYQIQAPDVAALTAKGYACCESKLSAGSVDVRRCLTSPSGWQSCDAFPSRRRR